MVGGRKRGCSQVDDRVIACELGARRGFLYMSHERDADLLKTMAIIANRAERRATWRIRNRSSGGSDFLQ
jgi:hypothetical protein